jgi:hypothetical protein
MSDDRHKVMPGQVLVEAKPGEGSDRTTVTLWCVCGVRAPRKDGIVTATLRSYSGRNSGGEGDVYASAEATAQFPDGWLAQPFYLVTITDVVRGKWPALLQED